VEGSRRKAILRATSGILVFAAGWFCFAAGFAGAFLVPGYRGEPYFQRFRIVYGILPLLGGATLLSLSGRLFFFALPSAWRSTATLGRVIGCCFLSAFGIMMAYAAIGSAIYERTHK